METETTLGIDVIDRVNDDLVKWIMEWNFEHSIADEG